jgi:hypothetical protein
MKQEREEQKRDPVKSETVSSPTKIDDSHKKKSNLKIESSIGLIHIAASVFEMSFLILGKKSVL